MIPLPQGRHIVKFLATRPEFVGVGWATARRLWDTFGHALYAMLADGDAESFGPLLDRNHAAIIIDAWRNQLALADCVVFFDENGIDTKIARKAVEFWGEQAIAKIRENPYRLLCVCPWDKVDSAATLLGTSETDPRRLVAAVESILYDRLDRKHTWCAHDQLVRATAKRLRTDIKSGERAVEMAVADLAAIPVETGFQPAGAAYMERFIEKRVEAHLHRDPIGRDLFLDAIPAEDITTFLMTSPTCRILTAEQREAVRMALMNTFSLLTGGAGVGKTTTLRAINSAAHHFGLTVYQIAIAGRAAKRMMESTGQPAQTAASWLKKASHGQLELGRHTMVIIDEASMIDLPTLYRILFHLPQHAPMLMVGDVAQLPPIGFGLVLHRLVSSDVVPRTELTRILRAREETGIPEVSLSIREGRAVVLPEYNIRGGGCSFIQAREEDIIDRIEDVLHDWKCQEVQVIAPSYAGQAGIDAINLHFHRGNRDRGQMAFDRFAVGDPCLWTVNDYERQLWNGSLGKIITVDPGYPSGQGRLVEIMRFGTDCPY
ncbi:AAA family ATPase [Rhizobium sp. 18055]|uniref:AAA family ATPase n=1 Tax=Rhizobium sp. 18055 TaxID=2681403 RepID=UPI00135ABF0F|nr:AAA family ATPase [Rhizobium sp. 18055]